MFECTCLHHPLGQCVADTNHPTFSLRSPLTLLFLSVHLCNARCFLLSTLSMPLLTLHPPACYLKLLSWSLCSPLFCQEIYKNGHVAELNSSRIKRPCKGRLSINHGQYLSLIISKTNHLVLEYIASFGSLI